jgi:hypothetical protein
MILRMSRNGRLDSRSFSQSHLTSKSFNTTRISLPGNSSHSKLARAPPAIPHAASSIRIRGRRSPNPQAGTSRARAACEPPDRERKAVGFLIQRNKIRLHHSLALGVLQFVISEGRASSLSRLACQRAVALGQKRRSTGTLKVSRFPEALQIKAVRATPPAMFRPTGPAQA